MTNNTNLSHPEYGKHYSQLKKMNQNKSKLLIIILQPINYFTKFISFCLLLFFTLQIGVAQSTGKDKLLLKEVGVFISLAKKQIKKERKLSDNHRASILKFIKKLEYDEANIIGADREYWLEGLSEKFTRAPQPILIKYHGRNEQTVQLENKHLELYESDSRLLLWENLKRQCEQIKNGENNRFFRDVKKDKISTGSDAAKNVLLCYLLENVERKRRYPYKTDMLARRSIRKVKFMEYPKISNFENLDSLVGKAYPYDGQINFFSDEFVHEFGFILLKKGHQDIYDSEFAIRWVDEKGRTLVKEASFDYNVQAITFDLPKPFFKPGKTYKYQILILPQKFEDKIQCKSEILDHTLISVLSEYLPSQPLNGKVIYEAYFRCSHYKTFIDKIDAIAKQNYILNEDFKLVIDLSEPFSDFEIYGNEIYESQLKLGANLSSDIVYPDGLYSIELKRVLTTPENLTVDTLDLNESIESLEKKYKEIKGINEKKYHEVEHLRELKLDQVGLHGETIHAITQDDFLAKRRFEESYSYEFTFPMLDSLSQIYLKVQQALKERIIERAEYFRLIDIKIKKLGNDKTRHPLKHYTDLEYAKLSNTLQKFLNAKMNLGNKRKCSLDVSPHLTPSPQ